MNVIVSPTDSSANTVRGGLMGESKTSKNNYNERTDWDTVHWGTHCVDCYPGNCPMRVYVKDGKVVRE